MRQVIADWKLKPGRDLADILYKYIFSTVKSSSVFRTDDILETGIYRWKMSYNIINVLNHFGDPEGAAMDEIDSKWSSNKIEVSYLVDNESKTRAVKTNTTEYVGNSNVVIIPLSDGKSIILTKDATAITYIDFVAPTSK